MSVRESAKAYEWIKNLRMAVSMKSEMIVLNNIHGEAYQITGLSDYIGCWRGRFLAIEFKVYPNTMTSKQQDFLMDILEAGGIAMLVEFHPRPNITKVSDNVEYFNREGLYVKGQEYQSLIKALNPEGQMIYKFLA